MQAHHLKSETVPSLASFVNNCLNDFNQLTALLKGPSRAASEMNHHLKNKLLLANEADSKAVIREILSHFLHIAQLKGVHNIILVILVKVINFVKMLEKLQTKQSLLQRNQEMSLILYAITDIIVLLKNQYKQNDITLRIIQATFSLIDEKFLQFANYNILTRIYTVCFQCCQSTPTIQNISISALYSLTQMIFSGRNSKDSLIILSQMLQNLFKGKRYLWIKDKLLNGLTWDLINVAIKSIPAQQLQRLVQSPQIMQLLMNMYNISAEKAFALREDSERSAIMEKSMSRQQNEKSINFKKGNFADFIRYYKTFIYFSIHLYINGNNELKQCIPFASNLHLFKVLYASERNSKLYLMLEGVNLLISSYSYFLIEQQHGIILLDVFNKICEQIDRSHHPIEFVIDKGDLYLEKLCGDFNKINQNDFVKIIKITILKLRKNLETQNYQMKQHLLEEQKSFENSIQEERGKGIISLKKRWERLIKIAMKIIRHLTSLNLKEGSNEQIVRKLIGQLQYWFIICPTTKLRNLILEQLLVTSTYLDSRIQSIKASQCLQIGSNIIYGYYDVLDTFGLAIIIRMIAGTQINWQEGRGFDELEQVCIMTEKLYTEQQLVHSFESFAKTIQAFVECLNGLLADIEQPVKSDSKHNKNHQRRHIQRYYKMIDYVLAKIESILYQNTKYLQKQWDFLTGFWISFSSNKNLQIKKKILNHLLIIIRLIIKTDISQYKIINIYSQLVKLHSIDISKIILIHLKQILLNLSEQEAILELFRILTIVLQTKSIEIIHQELYQYLQMIIKQLLFQVTSIENINKIIDYICFISKDKGEEYKVVDLIWSISDHLKTLHLNQQEKQNKQVWIHLFKKIITLAEISKNGETKQTCIHAFTQIIAQSIQFIGEHLFIQILQSYYLQIFSILMSFSKDKQSTQESTSKKQQIDQVLEQQKEAKMLNIDMIRIGIKNFIKITRKCLHIEPHISKMMFIQVFGHLQTQLHERKANTIQYLVELNVLLQYFQEIHEIQEFKTLNLDEEIRKLIVCVEENHSVVNKTTFTWKKYFGVFEEIKKCFYPN